MYFRFLAPLSLAAMAFAAAPALADSVEFELHNDSTQIITYFYASPSTSEEWGEDLLEEFGVIEPGYVATVEITSVDGECLFDFFFENAEGGELLASEIDICSLESYTIED